MKLQIMQMNFDHSCHWRSHKVNFFRYILCLKSDYIKFCMHGNIFMLKICIMYKSLNFKVIEDNFFKNINSKRFRDCLQWNLLLYGNFDLTSYGQRFVLVSLTFIYLIHYLSIHISIYLSSYLSISLFISIYLFWVSMFLST